MMKEQLGEKAAWVRVVERCERSRRACAIRARLMFPTEIWKKVESNGWGLSRPPMQGAIGNWFGRRTAIPLPGLLRISMTHGSRNDLDRIGEKTPWRLPWRSKMPTYATRRIWEG